MFDHVGLKVAHFAASLGFYTRALAPLGFVPQHVDEAGKSAGFGAPGAPLLWISEGAPATAALHLAFSATGRDVVARFHAAALAAGGRDHGAPGLRPDYGPGYYAAFVLDPDGNNIEAVIHEGG